MKTVPRRDLGKSLYLLVFPLPHLSNGDKNHIPALLTGSLWLSDETVDRKAL